MKKLNLIFILPVNSKTISDYVRAKCLREFETDSVNFIYFDIKANNIFNKRYLNKIIMIIYFFYFYIKQYRKIENKIFYIIKPYSPIFINFVKKFTRCKVVIDINDPLHTFPWIGEAKLLKMLALADEIVFESIEYAEYCVKKYNIKNNPIIIEDTPQHEIIYGNQKSRPKIISWVGSEATSDVLIDVKVFLKRMTEIGYVTILLGASKRVVEELKKYGVLLESIEVYDDKKMSEILINSQYSIVPMKQIEKYTLRGNLKAKICMSYGSCVLASDIPMHARLIENEITGLLIKDFNILDVEKLCNYNEEIGFNASKLISLNYSRLNHAKMLCEMSRIIMNYK